MAIEPEPPSPHDSPSPAEVTPDPTSRLRTWWHPLLAGLLRSLCGNAYHVQEEVHVGQKPLQIDIILLERNPGILSDEARRMLSGLVEYLNEHTLIEFKGPTTDLRYGDFATFLAYAFLYCAQSERRLNASQLTLLVLAPRLTGPYLEELNHYGVTPSMQSPGIWSLEGPLIYRIMLIETSILGNEAHPLLAVVSPSLLANPAQVFDALTRTGCQMLASYILQQVQNFQSRGEEFLMQHLGTDEWNRILHETVKRNLTLLTPEELRAALPPQERVKGLSPDDLRAALPPQERVKGLSPDDLRAALPPQERVIGLSPDDLRAALPPQERVKGLSPDDLRAALPPQERVKGLSPDDLLEVLSPEDRKQLLERIRGSNLEEGPSQP